MGDSDDLSNFPSLEIHYRTKSTRKVVLILPTLPEMKDKMSFTNEVLS